MKDSVAEKGQFFAEYGSMEYTDKRALILKSPEISTDGKSHWFAVTREGAFSINAEGQMTEKITAEIARRISELETHDTNARGDYGEYNGNWWLVFDRPETSGGMMPVSNEDQHFVDEAFTRSMRETERPPGINSEKIAADVKSRDYATHLGDLLKAPVPPSTPIQP